MPRVRIREVLPELSLPPYFVSANELGWLRTRLRAAGFEVFEASVGDCADERCLLGRLGDALAFPDYFGQNWDAFDDCLGDLQREQLGLVALVVNGSDALLRASPHAFVRSVHLLQDAVQSAAQDLDEGLQLEILFVGDFNRCD